MAKDITIAEAVEQLRVQLAAAQAQLAKVQREGGAGKDLRFLTKSVEVELAVVFKTEVEGGVGLKAWFLDVSGKTKGSDEATHKIKLNRVYFENRSFSSSGSR
jgi:NTP-dependent ternary system trypsin peptidase co-occuring protein